MRALSRTKLPVPDLEIRKGTLAVHAQKLVRVLAVCALDRIQVKDLGTGEQRWVKAGHLSSPKPEVLCASATIPHPADANPEAEAQAMAWTAALATLPATGRASQATRVAIALRFNVSVRTVDRRYARYALNPLPAMQLPSFSGPRPGARYLSPAIEGMIDLAISEHYLTLERLPMTAVLVRTRALCVAAGIHPPSYKTIRLRIRAKDPHVTARKRLGTHEGDAVQAPSIRGLRVEGALDVVQIDHALIDLMVVSESTREVVGRPWITLAIDVATRCVVGYYLSFDPPNQTAVGLCLDHACFPKDAWLHALGVEADYPMFGKMRSVHWDNAKTFQAKGVQVQCQRYGIHPKPRPVRQPHYGAYIERYIGNVMGKLHMLPGTTFSNSKQRGNYRSEHKAVMSLRGLEQWVALEIAGVYHNTPHRGLQGRCPADVWREAWQRPDGSVVIPPLIGDRRDFLVGFLPSVYRSIQREGVALHGLHYWDPALTPLINDGHRYAMHYDQRNLSIVYLRHQGHYIDIPLLDRSQPAFSLYELKETKRALRQRDDGHASEQKMFAALAQQREIQDTQVHTSKAARRKVARRPESPATLCLTAVDYTLPAETLDAYLGEVR